MARNLAYSLLFLSLFACAETGVEPATSDASPGALGDASRHPVPDASPILPPAASDSGTSGPSLDAASSRPQDAGLDTSLPAAPADAGAGSLQLLLVDGKTVTVYLPSGADPELPLPVVFSLHGLAIPAVAMVDVTGLPAVADKERFIGVFPDGSGGSWNTGGSVCGLGGFTGSGADDVTYIENILKEIEKSQAIDRGHVFMSGFSMGGYGTNNLACKRPDLFRAAAPASSGFPTSACAAEPIPVMIFHGTSDATIDYACAKGARDFWVSHNHCAPEVDVLQVMGGKCEWNRGCPARGQVVLCSFDGMGHGWAGSLNPFALGGPQFESATSLMWSFFKKQF